MRHPIKIDRSFLPPECCFDRKEDLYADFYEDGSLRSLGIYIAGSCDDNFQLLLEKDRPCGKVVLGKYVQTHNREPRWPPEEYYADGKRRWMGIDNEEERAPWVDWVKKWIDFIAKRWRHLAQCKGPGD
jgi:hypothetical protein